jgi:glycosyltransferase involved in cell wall biosynthesis
MPVHNGEEFVGRAVASVLAQTYDRLELIVIDDGSTDATGRAVASIGDSRVTLLTLGSNAGAYVARNHALRRASGEFIAFLDADDAWFPSKLERQVAFLRAHPRVDMVHARTIDIFPSGERLARSLHRRASDYRENLCHDRVSTSTVVVRRAMLDRVGTFDEAFRAMGDWDLWARIMRVGRVAHLAEPLTATWLREGSLQRGSVEVFERFHRLVLDKRVDELERHGLTRKAEAAHEYAVAAKLAWAGHRRKARRRLARSLRARPSVEALALLMVLSLRPESAQRVRMRLRVVRKALSQ